MYQRNQFETITSRIKEDRHFIQVIAGPRQVGKSTLINQVLESIDVPYHFCTADSAVASNSGWISEQWETARSNMAANNLDEYLLVIDEIQKIFNWSEVVKKEWDQDSLNKLNIKVILLGSSRLLLKKGLTESLAGRFEMIRMGHWTFTEMHEAFGWDINQYIYFGGYPGCAYMIDNESRWKQYIIDSIIEPAIAKDALMTATVYKPALLRQLFELGCSYSGELLSLNKMLGQLDDAGNVTTLAGYLEILSECHLIKGLQKYANDNSRKYNSIPKYQVYNQALLSVYNGHGYMEERTNPTRWGRWTESAVGAYLVGLSDQCDYKVYYWRENSDEVDFILSRRGRLIAIEVKSGKRTTSSGLTVFREKFSPKNSIIVGSGGIPVEEFLHWDLGKLLDN